MRSDRVISEVAEKYFDLSNISCDGVNRMP